MGSLNFQDLKIRLLAHPLLLILLVTTFGLQAQAQFLPGGGFGQGTFSGVAGYVGAGIADYTVLTPSSRFRLDQGAYVYVGGEREIGKSALFVTLSANFLDSEGQSFYDYTRLGGGQYTSGASDVDFRTQGFQLGLGLKLKFFPRGWFRPYLEAGGLFGYHTISYSNSDSAIVPVGGAAAGGERLDDGLTGFGYYGEVGLDIDFNDYWGIRVAGRYQITETRKFETLGLSEVKFEAKIVQIALARRFRGF